MSVYILELFIIIIVVALFIYFARVRGVTFKIPLPKLLFFIIFFYLLALSQVMKKPSVTYPFTYWGMYSTSEPSPTYSEHRIQLQNGTRIHYPYEIITFTSQRALMKRLELKAMIQSEKREDLLKDTISSLVWLFEKNFPGQKIVKFTLYDVHIRISESENEFSINKTERFKFEFSE